MSPQKIAVIFFSTVFLLLGCNRKEFNAYTGTYQGNEGTKSWNGVDPAIINIEPGKSLEVLKDGKFVNVLSEKVHIKDLEPGEEYFEGDIDNHFTLKFSNDSVYFFRTSGNSTEGSSFSFIGAKTN